MNCQQALPDDVRTDLVNQVKSRIDAGDDAVHAASEAVRTHINFDRLDVKSNTEAMLQWFQKNLDGVVTKGVDDVRGLARVKELAEQELRLYGTPEAFIDSLTKDATLMRQMESRLVAARTLRNTLAESIDGLTSTIQRGGPDAADAVAKLERQAGAMLKLHYSTQVIQTEGARLPSSGRIVAGTANLDLERMVKAISDTVRGGGLDGRRLVAQLAAADGDAKSILAILKPFELAGQKAFSKALSLHNEYWINSILSGFKTAATNLTSNLVNTLLLPAERIVGGALALDSSAVASGFRLYAGLAHSIFDVFTLSGRAGTMGSTLGRGFESFKSETPFLDALVHGGEKAGPSRAWSSANLGLDAGNPLGMLVDGLGQVIRLPTRLLSSSDEIFKQANYRAALRDMAIQEAEKAGLLKAGKGKEVQEFVKRYVENGFGEFGQATNEAALAYAQRSTFTSPLRDGTLGKSISDMLQNHPGMRLFLPFVRTPTNVLRQFWQYAPGLNLLQQEFRELLTHSDANIRRGAWGRLAVGSAFTYAVGTMALAGKVTGGGPANKEQRDALMATGWRPYSIAFEGADGKKTFVEYRRIDPLASLFGLVADYVEATHGLSDFDSQAVMAAMGMSIAKNVTSRTYLQGISEAANLLSDPDENAKRWLQTRAASYVPNALNQANTDPNFREVRGMLDAMRARIPGLSETLPPKRNYLGEVIAKPSGWSPWDEDGDFKLSPFAYSKSVGDPVKEEIANLRIGVSKPSPKLGPVDLTLINSPHHPYDAYDRYQQLTGEVKVKGRTLSETLNKLVASQEYKDLPTPTEANDRSNPRVRAVLGLFADYREAARKELLKEYPQVAQTVQGLQKMRRAQHNPTIQKILNY